MCPLDELTGSLHSCPLDEFHTVEMSYRKLCVLEIVWWLSCFHGMM